MHITMKKAIEVLEINIKEGRKGMPPDVEDSLNLAISNMNTVLFVRHGGAWDFHALFPGEAPEKE